MKSVRKSYISRTVKTIEIITCRKGLKYLLAFDQESQRKQLSFISAENFIQNNNVYDSGVKTSIINA